MTIEVKTGTTTFVSVKEIGQLDDKGKRVLAIGYGGKVPAPKDEPLSLVEWFIEELLPHCRYSSDEAARADLAKLKTYVEAITMKG